MSRIGKKPVSIPDGVKVAVADRTVTVEGKLGKLEWTHRSEIEVDVDGGGALQRRVQARPAALCMHDRVERHDLSRHRLDRRGIVGAFGRGSWTAALGECDVRRQQSQGEPGCQSETLACPQ